MSGRGLAKVEERTSIYFFSLTPQTKATKQTIKQTTKQSVTTNKLFQNIQPLD